MWQPIDFFSGRNFPELIKKRGFVGRKFLESIISCDLLSTFELTWSLTTRFFKIRHR